MEIEDNGVGISEGKIASNHSIGLLGMRERAMMLGGYVDIFRGASGGTQLIITMPLGTSHVR